VLCVLRKLVWLLPTALRNDIATTLPLKVFIQIDVVADFFRQKLYFTGKTAKSRFVPPFAGLRGNVHGPSMARWKARGRLPISANCNLFASSHG